jgi:hypothetical protein
MAAAETLSREKSCNKGKSDEGYHQQSCCGFFGFHILPFLNRGLHCPLKTTYDY